MASLCSTCGKNPHMSDHGQCERCYTVYLYEKTHKGYTAGKLYQTLQEYGRQFAAGDFGNAELMRRFLAVADEADWLSTFKQFGYPEFFQHYTAIHEEKRAEEMRRTPWRFEYSGENA